MKKIMLIITMVGILVSPAHIYSQQCGINYFTPDFSQPFVIEGEGSIPNFIGLEPLPDGRLLAQTPLSYKFLDPETGKFSDLPQGFPEGEITQWEEDFAVVRTRTGSDPYYNFVFTIWPGNKRFLAQKDRLCFLDKEGSYVTILPDKDIYKGWLAYFDKNSNLVWKSELFLYSSVNSPIRFFDDKVAVIESYDDSLENRVAIYEKSDGLLLKSGVSYGKNCRFLKPKQVGKKFFLANSEIYDGILKNEDRGARACAWENYYEVADYNPKARLFIYKKINANNETIYECEFSQNTPAPYGYNNHYLLCVANGVIFFKFNRDGDCCLVDVENKAKPLIIPKCIGYRTFHFSAKNHVVFKSTDVLHVFSLERKLITKKIPWSDKPIIYGSGVVTWPIATEGNGIIYKAMSTQEPEKSVQVREGFMLENHKDGIIACRWGVLEGEEIAYLYGFVGSITPLGKATHKMRIEWCGSWKSNIYILATLDLFPYSVEKKYLYKSVNGEWKIELDVTNLSFSLGFIYFRNGRLLTSVSDIGKAIIDLDNMSIIYIKPPAEYLGAQVGSKLFSDCFMQTFGIKEGKKLLVYSFMDGKTTFYDNFLWASYDKICLQENGEFYILSKSLLVKIEMSKNSYMHQINRTMGDYFINKDYTSSSHEDTNKLFLTNIHDTENNILQRIPVYTTRTLSMPKELYPTMSYTNYTVPPADGFLPKSKKCATYKIERTGEFTFDLSAKYDDFSGYLWFVKYGEESPITMLNNPIRINLKNGEKLRLDFSNDMDANTEYQGFVVQGNGFFETDSIGIYNRTKSNLPLFGGMQTGPSGESVVCTIFWENKK